MKLTRIALALTAVAGLALAATAQPEPAPKAAEPAIEFSGPHAEQARTVLNRARKAYATARTYHDAVEMRFRAKTDPDQGMFPEQTMRMQLAFARPDKLALNMTMAHAGQDPGGVARIISDGKKSWIESPVMEQYVELAAANPLDIDALRDVASQGWVQLFHPVLTAVVGRVNAEAHAGHDHGSGLDILESLRSITSAEAGPHKDKPGIWLKGTLDSEGLGAPGQRLPLEVWFDDASGLVGMIRVDFTAFMQQQMQEFEGEFKITSAAAEFDFTKVAINEPLPEDAFAFKPNAAFEKVDAFEMEMPDFDDEGFAEPESDLLNKPAPAFSGTLLDGSNLSLESLAGKVVVIDFWATWCPPCVQALPAMQGLWKTYESRNVVFLGMNLDDPKMDNAEIQKFLADKGVTFRQMRDLEGKTSNDYNVSGIPCTVIIDTKGVVRNVHVGFMPGMEEDLKNEIEAALKSEN